MHGMLGLPVIAWMHTGMHPKLILFLVLERSEGLSSNKDEWFCYDFKESREDDKSGHC